MSQSQYSISNEDVIKGAPSVIRQAINTRNYSIFNAAGRSRDEHRYLVSRGKRWALGQDAGYAKKVAFDPYTGESLADVVQRGIKRGKNAKKRERVALKRIERQDS